MCRDGLVGHPEYALYDRIIATCAVRSVPPEWIAQTRPEGRILLTIGGWLYGFGLAALDVDDAGQAHGRFLPGTVSFMLARPHAQPRLNGVPAWALGDAGIQGESPIGPEVLLDWTSAFVAQLAAPDAQRIGVSIDGGPMTDYLLDLGSESFAALVPRPDGTCLVRQGGPIRLWDRIERSIMAWRAAGSPDQESFTVTAGTDAQTICLDTNGDQLTWTLPLDPRPGKATDL